MINKIVDLLNNIIDIEILEDDGWFIQGTPSNKLIRLCKTLRIPNLKALNVPIIDIEHLAERILEDKSKFTDVYSGKNTSFKPNLISLTKRLIQFFEIYTYDIKIVEDKLEKYIEYAKNNPSSTNSCLIYYILKDGVSKLADACEREPEETQEIDYFKQIL